MKKIIQVLKDFWVNYCKYEDDITNRYTNGYHVESRL